MTRTLDSLERRWPGWLSFSGVLAAGAILYSTCRDYPAELPVWLPWDFSWLVYLAVVLSLGWFFIGRRRLAPEGRPGTAQTLSFVLGVGLMYGVVQTRYDYFAQHMFFVHRLQHLVLHHLAPFMIALAWPGEAIWVGMPGFLKPLLRSRPVRGLVAIIQNPWVAPALFVGLIYVWLIPDVHVRVMLDSNLYQLMNWSMAVDGLFFWALLLDPNPKPPARIGFGTRVILSIAVVPPQIAVGAILALSTRDFYPVYEICGRVMAIPAVVDQNYGGLVLWIPSSMMSVIGLILVLNNMRRSDERAEHAS